MPSAIKATAPATVGLIRQGSLTIAGSGIRSVGHITLETLSHMGVADKVYYLVCDPVTKAYIQDNSKGPCIDLSVFYSLDKNRYDSYVEMAEVMLQDVRDGQDVLGIFYGHPGVFVSPSHRAVSIARQEGYRANMLPGVSAEDYLFADLGFDPALRGCMSCEATELLMRNRTLDSSVHNIIWQVGAIGITTMNYEVKSKFHLLVDRLVQDFGEDHVIVHYVGAVLPISDPVIETFKISDLRSEDVAKRFNTVSTFYVPPRHDTGIVDSSMVKALGMAELSSQMARSVHVWEGSRYMLLDPYGTNELATVARFRHSGVPSPDTQLLLRASPAMKQFMVDLALKPNILRSYKADPSSVLEGVEGLTVVERVALKLGTSCAVHVVMHGTRADVISGRELTVKDLEVPVGSSAFHVIIIVVIIVTVAIISY
ncbi:hypothetical protein FRC09_005260 [Ceratobasidium sp. 395]|nr:hypothetical protein FRC09_005260 [Ceratobasidium sp. 395]